jgi:hypothetical protein
LSLHTTTRVPVDDQYAALVGKAVYVFSYYEWTIIWIVEHLNAGFVSSYSRGNPMTSGDVQKHLQNVIDNSITNFSKISQHELQECCDTFGNLIVKRNALIHAHPITDTDGTQILAYQTKISKPLPDMKWPTAEVEKIIFEIDVAASNTSVLLDKIR